MLQQQQKLSELLLASSECSERGLYNSAHWAAELAEAMTAEGVEPASLAAASDKEDRDSVSEGEGAAADDADAAAVDTAEAVKYRLAKTLFDLRQYDRTMHALLGCDGNKAFFLSCYSQYLAGEMRKADIASDPLEPLDQDSAENEELAVLREKCMKRDRAGKLDGYGHYLLGLVYKAQKNNGAASNHFVKAAQGTPLHWGGWSELASLAVDAADFESMKALPLPTHWVREFFVSQLALALHMPEEAITLYTKLLDLHPASNSLRGQLAETYYEDRKFDDAQALLEQLRKDDPFRLENMDTYSNILYVKELKPQLSYLAHESTRIDQYRVETCCIVGNYYSLKGRHEKAVLYFRRALKLDRKYLAAWTLMGHEYLELKNAPAAIEAYRRAVDTNPMDYRAWYGLGQTYMPTYSLYYYRQSQRLRPYDARMWTALAQTYKELQQWSHAAKCYERNIALNPVDTKALHFLGFIYVDNLEPPDHDKAAFYFRKAIDVAGDDAEENESTLRAYEFLAEHYRDKEMFDDAKSFAKRLMDFGGKYNDTGKALLKELEDLQGPSSPSSMGGGGGGGVAMEPATPDGAGSPTWF
eukprot:gene293-34886_t